jgi:hypothetical protein
MMLLAIIAATLASGLGGQTPKKIEVSLTYTPYEVFDIMMGMYGAPPDEAEAIRDEVSRGSEIKPPIEVAMRSYQQVRLGGKSYVAVFAQKDVHAQNPDCLWIDWNGDKVITDDEATTSIPIANGNNPKDEEAASYRCFKPVKQPNKAIPIAFLVRYNSSISVVPAGGMQAVIPIGKGIKLSIIDMNRNGRIGDPYSPTSRDGCDTMLLDRNGNGKFDTIDPSGPQEMENWETLPFMKTVQLGSGFYDLSIDQAGKMLTATPYQGPIATVQLTGGKPNLLFYGSKEMFFASPVNGAFCVPYTEPDGIQLLYKVVDPKGKPWTVGLNLAKADKVLVSGKTTTVKCGLPFGLKLSETHNANGFKFALDLSDAGGHKLSHLSDGSAPRPPAPQLIVTDANGKVVKTLTFAFG